MKYHLTEFSEAVKADQAWDLIWIGLCLIVIHSVLSSIRSDQVSVYTNTTEPLYIWANHMFCFMLEIMTLFQSMKYIIFYQYKTHPLSSQSMTYTEPPHLYNLSEKWRKYSVYLFLKSTTINFCHFVFAISAFHRLSVKDKWLVFTLRILC
jgi:hypothetical protein